jgi:hypothetical protein
MQQNLQSKVRLVFISRSQSSGTLQAFLKTAIFVKKNKELLRSLLFFNKNEPFSS